MEFLPSINVDFWNDVRRFMSDLLDSPRFRSIVILNVIQYRPTGGHYRAVL